MASRAHKTRFTEWWWTVDKTMLFIVLVLMACGFVLSLAASPPIALKRSLPAFYYVQRHAIFLMPSIAVMIATSFLSPRMIRRTSLIVFGFAFLGLLATLVFGSDVKGASRWLNIGSFSVQPSEFIKPSFIVIAGWLMAEAMRRPGFPGNLITFIMLMIVIALFMLQPDFGQTTLITMIWAGMFFIASMPWFWVLMTGAAASGGLAAAYTMLPHVQSRIDRFFHGTGDNLQVNTAVASISHGGWFGVGPGEGIVKRSLPDSHTDFIFAVAGEEFGILLCILIVLIFMFIALRGLRHAIKIDDNFTRLTVSGLTFLFGLQAMINMSVNLNLIPAKGMTLPFISYGGSSMIAGAFAMGLLLALTRRRSGGSTRSIPKPQFPAGKRA
ncbi:MAG: putative peptidoglycan glycosyltransferase FtsW [Pseudomonadota bacterium]